MNENIRTNAPLTPETRGRLERCLTRRWGPLRFPGRVERTFREHYHLRWRAHALLSLGFWLALYCAFGLLDLWLSREQLLYFWVIRYGVVLPFGIAAFIVCWRATRDRQVQFAYAALMLVSGASVAAMMAKLPHEHTHVYTAFAMLAIAFGYVVAPLRLWYSTVTGILISAVYFAGAIWLRPIDALTLEVGIALLVGVNLLGVYGAFVLDMEMRRDFAHSLLLELDRRRLASANIELSDLSSRDHLTGVANRRSLERFLEDAWTNARAASLPISALMLDLDHFRKFNEAHGQQAGDRCLHDVAAHILPLVRQPTDLVARYGGEEFVVVLPGTDHDDAMEVAERIRVMVEELPMPGSGDEDGTDYITVSIGVSTAWPASGTHPSELVRSADRALYAAKQEGRNRVRHSAD